MIEEQEIQAQDILLADTEPPEPSTTSRANHLATSRQRAYSADLLKAHMALMEKEIILPKQPELFRLIHRHYHALQTWHDQHTASRIQRDPTVIRLVRHLTAITPGSLYARLKEPGHFPYFPSI